MLPLKVRQIYQEKRPLFPQKKCDPRMPAIQPIVAKHLRAMESQDKYLAQCVTQPPLSEFQGQANIGE